MPTAIKAVISEEMNDARAAVWIQLESAVADVNQDIGIYLSLLVVVILTQIHGESFFNQ